MNVIDVLNREQLKDGIPEFRSGDTVKVYSKVLEGGKERTQMFEGVVIVRKGGGAGESITVRRDRAWRGRRKDFPPAKPPRRADRGRKARRRFSKPPLLSEREGR